MWHLKSFSWAQVTPGQVTVTALAMAGVWLLGPELAHAAVTFGEIGENVAESSKGIAKGITMAGYAGGTGMGVWGFVEMFKAGKRQGDATYGGGFTKLLIAGGVLALGEMLGSGSATLLGSDQTTGLGELGIK